ncbi:MAG: ABC transporter substrate-binding protein [Syntrophobacteraceae bacterium]
MRKAAVFGLLTVLLTYAVPLFIPSIPLASGKFTVGWQPYYISSFHVAIIKELGLWKKYLPAGTEIEFQEALHGSVSWNSMLSGKCQVAYLSVASGNLACSKRDQAEIRFASNVGISNGMRCALLMVRADAPDFKSQDEAVRWLNGKVVASPRGSCADQFLRVVFWRHGIQPAEYLNQSIEVLQSSLRSGKVDAAAVWEPVAGRVGNLAGDGLAKIVATGSIVGNKDIGMVIMRGDFIDKHPSLVEGYLKAELEALLFLTDPVNQRQAVEMISKYAVGIPKKVIWHSLYGEIPTEVGGTSPRETFSFIIDEKIRKNINEVWARQYEDKLVRTERPPGNIIDDRHARKVLSAYNLKSPIGVIKGQPPSENPF